MELVTYVLFSTVTWNYYWIFF